MALFMDYMFVFLLKSIFFTLIVGKSQSKSFPCDFGYYFNITEDQCKKCSSVCPPNRIIDILCSDTADLKCRRYNLNFNFNTNFKSQTQKNIRKDGRTNKGKKSSPLNDELTTVENEDKYWKRLAFALIGLLSVLIIATFIILIFVYRKLQRSIVIKQSEEDLMDDADSGYVVIRAIHHLATPLPDNPILSLYPREQTDIRPPPILQASSPTSIDSGRPADSLLSTSTLLPGEGKLCLLPKVYQPQRRMLNYDADDVFESDDNGSVVNHLTDPKEKLQALIDEDTS